MHLLKKPALCIITNDYFYFRFRPFVNRELLVPAGDRRLQSYRGDNRGGVSMRVPRNPRPVIGLVLSIALGLTFSLSDCSKPPESHSNATETKPSQASTISVNVQAGGPVILTTSSAEFQVRPDGYVQASLLQGGKNLSLDEPATGASASSDFVRVSGKDVHFKLDFEHAQVREATGKMGTGKRVEIPTQNVGPADIDLQGVLALEVYDQFPNILLSTIEYKNAGKANVTLEKAVNQRRRLNARLESSDVKPW